MSLRDWFENRRNKQLNADLVESKISGDDLLKLWEKCYNIFPRALINHLRIFLILQGRHLVVYFFYFQTNPLSS